MGRGKILADAAAKSNQPVTPDMERLMGAFKTPSLRGAALSGPYFHDGSVKDARRSRRPDAQGRRGQQDQGRPAQAPDTHSRAAQGPHGLSRGPDARQQSISSAQWRSFLRRLSWRRRTAPSRNRSRRFEPAPPCHSASAEARRLRGEIRPLQRQDARPPRCFRLDTLRGQETWHILFHVRGGVQDFRVDDRMESWMDTETLASLRFVRT